MNSELVHFEKYSVAPSPSRNYYGIKIINDEVILYLWKVSHGPHLSPIIKKSKFSNYHKDKLLKDEIFYAFGPDVVNYIDLIITEGPNTLLTLPKKLTEKLAEYLELEDIAQLSCVSRIGNEVFNSNEIWEYMYKKLKGINELSDMERQLGKSMGFKKLSKDHQVRNSVSRKFHKSPREEKPRATSKPRRAEKFVRSASVSMLKPAQSSVAKSPKKKSQADGLTKKSSMKLKTKMPKKSISEGKSLIPDEPLNYLPKQLAAAGEGCYTPKNQSSIGKFLFVNDDLDTAELHLHKEYIKTAILQSDLSNADLEDIIRKKNLMTMQTPRNKSSIHIEELKQPAKKSSKKSSHKNKSSSKPNTSRNNLVGGIPPAGDESDEGGMSFLMKRYLEASNEVARKFSDIERFTKSSSTQVDMPPEKPDSSRRITQSRRMSTFGLPPGNIGSSVPATDRSANRNLANATSNIFSRLRPACKKA